MALERNDIKIVNEGINELTNEIKNTSLYLNKLIEIVHNINYWTNISPLGERFNKCITEKNNVLNEIIEISDILLKYMKCFTDYQERINNGG